MFITFIIFEQAGFSKLLKGIKINRTPVDILRKSSERINFGSSHLSWSFGYNLDQPKLSISCIESQIERCYRISLTDCVKSN